MPISDDLVSIINMNILSDISWSKVNIDMLNDKKKFDATPMFYIWSSISDFCDYINFVSRAQDMLAPSKRQLLNQKEQTPA